MTSRDALTSAIDYATAGPLTDLSSIRPSALERLPEDAVEICRPAHSLVIQPHDAQAAGLPQERFAENNIHPAAALVEVLLAINPAPLEVAREPGQRVIGTCRHFAVLSCALLRYRGVPARARCGFATYFQPGRGVDHWITEYWHDGEDRWVRVDSEILGTSLLEHPEDLRPGLFLTGGEAWSAFRAGRLDASTFGVYGTENWGPGEIRANAIRDLAAVNKVEMLPWDEWGRMDASFKGETGADYDELLDRVAVACASDDSVAAVELYGDDELRVPDQLIG